MAMTMNDRRNLDNVGKCQTLRLMKCVSRVPKCALTWLGIKVAHAMLRYHRRGWYVPWKPRRMPVVQDMQNPSCMEEEPKLLRLDPEHSQAPNQAKPARHCNVIPAKSPMHISEHHDFVVQATLRLGQWGGPLPWPRGRDSGSSRRPFFESG